MYSVRSAYRKLQERKGKWCSQDNQGVWSLLWKVKAPPKSLNLVWRALAGCLPMLVALQHKHVNVQVICLVCGSDIETITHALVQCRYARQCWRSLNIDIPPGDNTMFPSWLFSILSMKDGRQSAEVVSLCWAVWKARNDLVWNKRMFVANKVVANAKEYLTQWTQAQDRNFVAPLQPFLEGDGAVAWVKPNQNSVKVTVDAATFEEQASFGIGLIARDGSGALIQAKSKLFQAAAEPVVAEAMAIKEALSWLISMDWQQVIVESDCLVAVQVIRSKTQTRSRFGVLVEECRALLLSLNNCQLYFIKRSANMAAHELAQLSYKYPDRSFSRSSIPTKVSKCILQDLSEQ